MTRKKRTDKIFFRYYEIPRDSYVLALFGEEWNRKYGSEGESLHFHNHLEVGYCYKGEGVIKLENGDYPYFPQTFTMIPKNCPHSTFGDQGGINSWEFLFIDVERFSGGSLSGTKPPGRGDQQENQQWRKISDPWKKSGSR